MLNSMELQTATVSATSGNDQKCCILKQGQRIIFEKEEAEIIRVKPLFVIRTKDRIVCGALQKILKYKGL